jgi:hypothetical protein
MGILRRHWRRCARAARRPRARRRSPSGCCLRSTGARASVLIATQKLSESFIRPVIQEDATERINALTSQVLSRQSLIEVVEQFDLYPELREREGIDEAASALAERITIELDPGIRAGSVLASISCPFGSAGKARRRRDERSRSPAHARRHASAQRAGA